MSGNPEHAHHKRGEHLARELHQFLERELGDDPEAVAHALRGAYDYLDTRTRLGRGVTPWPEPEDTRPPAENGG